MANFCEIIFSTSLALFGLILEMYLVERTDVIMYITCSCNHVENLFISASGLLKSSSIWRRSLAAFLSLLMHAQPRRCSCCKASLLHHKIKDSYWTDHVLVHINSPRVFSFLISTSNSVVFIAARISYIRFFIAAHMYDFHDYNHYSSLGRFI